MFEESSTKEVEECVICMDRKASTILPCAHAYCEQCIDAWLVLALVFSLAGVVLVLATSRSVWKTEYQFGCGFKVTVQKFNSHSDVFF